MGTHYPTPTTLGFRKTTMTWRTVDPQFWKDFHELAKCGDREIFTNALYPSFKCSFEEMREKLLDDEILRMDSITLDNQIIIWLTSCESCDVETIYRKRVLGSLVQAYEKTQMRQVCLSIKTELGDDLERVKQILSTMVQTKKQVQNN